MRIVARSRHFCYSLDIPGNNLFSLYYYKESTWSQFINLINHSGLRLIGGAAVDTIDIIDIDKQSILLRTTYWIKANL